MDKLINKHWYRTDEYEPVEQFPDRYIVWNIGRANFPFENYIPLAKPDPANKYHVRLTDLKALKCESEGLALFILHKASAGGYGADFIDRTVYERLRTEYYESIDTQR